MKKKFLLLFLTIISAVCLAVGISACDYLSGGQSGSSSDAEQSQTDSTESSTTNSGQSLEDDTSGGDSQEEDTTTVSVTSVTLSSTTLTLEVGKSATLTATVLPENATNKTVNWTTSDSTIATVTDGVVTAVSAGNAVIMATTTDGGKVAFCNVTVTEPEEITAAITGVTNGAITGKDIYIFADYSTDSLTLSGEVTCTDNCSWKLYASDGITEIPTKVIAALADGESRYYIVVTSTVDTAVAETYTLTIYKSFAVTVTYYNGSEVLKTETAYTGYTYSAAYIPEITDYIFNYWKTAEGQEYSATILSADLNLYADLTAMTHTYSEEWSYDNTAHWHVCTDEDCDKISDYEEHTPVDEGSVIGNTIYYTCEVCGATYTSTVVTYIVNIVNKGGAGVSGVSVSLYDSDGNLLSTAASGTNGATRFRGLTLGNYTAKVDASSIPAGYSYDSEDDLTISFSSSVRSQTVTLATHVITESAMPSGTTYSVNSVVYDFETTAYFNDGTSATISLAEYLENYDAVVINFFYTTCTPCLQEFPYINQAYNYTTSSTTGGYYNQRIAFICVDYTGQDTTLNVLKNFLTGSYAYDNITYIYDNTTGLTAAFGADSFPTTVVIDKYGMVSMIETGSQPTISYWATLFERYLLENYDPTYSSDDDEEKEDTTGKTAYDMPESGEIANAIVTANSYTTTDTFAFSAYEVNGVADEYSWAWLIADGTTAVGGKTNYIYSSNSNNLGTYAILVIDVKLEKGQAVFFDYYLETELGGDYFYIQVDSVLQAQLSGVSDSWQTFCYVAQYSGYYQITLTYQKDTSVDEDGDKVYVTNMYLADSASAITETTSLATPDLLYNAATAYTLDGSQDNYYPGKGYKNYVTVYVGSDGYYRVNLYNDETKDPYLLADLYYTTAWNSDYSIWEFVVAYSYDEDSLLYYTGGILYNNTEWNKALEEYTWVQNNCPWGYVPVDEYLAIILKAVTQSYGTDSQQTNENQWLEVCRYYIHYGTADTDCKSTTNLASSYGLRMAATTDVILNSNTTDDTAIIHADISTPLHPVGYYYSFTVEESGVYLFYTDEGFTDEDGLLADGETVGADPFAWITDSTGHLISDASCDNYDLTTYVYDSVTNTYSVANSDTSSSATLYYNNNFYIYVYLEANATYMIGAAMSFVGDCGEYDIYCKYLGTSYTYFTAAVYDDIYTYTYDEANDTYNYYLPAVFSDYYRDTDDKYYAVLDNGSVTPIYVNMLGITWLNANYSSYTIEQAINAGYWSGTQYDAVMKEYLAAAKENDGELYGYVQATYELVAILNAYINGSSTITSSDYAGTAWMLTAYFYRTIDSSSYYVAAERVID